MNRSADELAETRQLPKSCTLPAKSFGNGLGFTVVHRKAWAGSANDRAPFGQRPTMQMSQTACAEITGLFAPMFRR
jgi:hypothetical protein